MFWKELEKHKKKEKMKEMLLDKNTGKKTSIRIRNLFQMQDISIQKRKEHKECNLFCVVGYVTEIHFFKLTSEQRLRN